MLGKFPELMNPVGRGRPGDFCLGVVIDVGVFFVVFDGVAAR